MSKVPEAVEENPRTSFREISRKVSERAKKLNEEHEQEKLRKEEVVEVEESEEVSNLYTL